MSSETSTSACHEETKFFFSSSVEAKSHSRGPQWHLQLPACCQPQVLVAFPLATDMHATVWIRGRHRLFMQRVEPPSHPPPCWHVPRSVEPINWQEHERRRAGGCHKGRDCYCAVIEKGGGGVTRRELGCVKWPKSKNSVPIGRSVRHLLFNLTRESPPRRWPHITLGRSSPQGPSMELRRICRGSTCRSP